ELLGGGGIRRHQFVPDGTAEHGGNGSGHLRPPLMAVSSRLLGARSVVALRNSCRAGHELVPIQRILATSRTVALAHALRARRDRLVCHNSARGDHHIRATDQVAAEEPTTVNEDPAWQETRDDAARAVPF